MNQSIHTHPVLAAFVANALFNQHALVRSGVPSEQATRITCTNENDQADVRQRSEVSDCCQDDIGYFGYSGLHTYCVRCGEACMLIVRQDED